MSEKQAKAERQEVRLRQSDERCEHCAFFQENAGVPNGGLCMRNPPQIAWGQGPQGQIMPMGSGYPPTLKASWCGEWQKGSMVKVAREIPKGSVIDFKNGSHN